LNRLCKIRLKGKFKNTAILSVYAPTEVSDEKEKENFYDSLDKCMDKISKHDMNFIMGDFIAKIGKEESIRSVLGRFSLHDNTSENGLLLAQFAEMHRMMIKSTCFPHKDIHKGTWKMPGTNLVNQIDHVVVSSKQFSAIMDVKTMRGPNCYTDHYLVHAIIRQRLANIQKDKGIKRKRWNTENLKNENDLK